MNMFFAQLYIQSLEHGMYLLEGEHKVHLTLQVFAASLLALGNTGAYKYEFCIGILFASDIGSVYHGRIGRRDILLQIGSMLTCHLHI